MRPEIHRRPDCRLCGGRELGLAFALAPSPPANAFASAQRRGGQQRKFPLDLFFCRQCAHLQLLDVVDPRILFEEYVYVSSTSPVFVDHFRRLADEILHRFPAPAGSLTLEIGSNDGALLRFFQQAGMTVLGVDPAVKIAAQATESGIPTLNAFFTPTLAREIRSDQGAAHYLLANNVCAHIDDLGAVLDGVRALLAPDGVFVFEVSYLADVVEKTLFDTIYHEHLDYHSVKPLIPFFRRHGLELIETWRVDSHGGSLRGVAQRAEGGRPVGASVGELVALEEAMGLDRLETFLQFAQRIETRKEQLTTLLRQWKQEGKSIAGYGAPAKAATLMHHFGLGPEMIDFIVDDSPWKQGLFSPGLHIPILPSSAIASEKPDAIVILAWNFAQPLLNKLADYRQSGGKCVVPLPEVTVY
ncbi:MAG: class I SAM-dependent methyltransferase [Magnetococcales bacterium]|nr:class I SAM-dependent methyltransferase [Magnetococcales bacterium]